MNNRTFYNEVLTDHNLHPMHKCELPDADMVHEGINADQIGRASCRERV